MVPPARLVIRLGKEGVLYQGQVRLDQRLEGVRLGRGELLDVDAAVVEGGVVGEVFADLFGGEGEFGCCTHARDDT